MINFSSDVGLDFDIDIEDMVPVLQAAARSPVYKDKVAGSWPL